MAETIQASADSLYYSANNASDYAGVTVDSPVAPGFSLLHSRAIWAFGLLIAVVLAKIVTTRPKLPAGTKELPKIPGELYIRSFHPVSRI